MEGQRGSPLHRGKDGIILPGGPTPLGGTDPITGLPHHHSHSHVHTHYHLHPGEQGHNQPPRSPSLNLEPNWLWRNPHSGPGHEMWLHPPGHPRHMIGSVEELNGVSPYFPGLYPPPSREFQLQQELMFSQGLKMEHPYPFSYPSLLSSREHLMRFSRPHDRPPRIETELRRLEAGEELTSASLLHRADPSRTLQRTPPLKNFDSASFLSTGHKPVTIDLSKDD